MTSTISEIEIIEALDFDPEDEDPCEVKSGCGRKATWVLHLMCCGVMDKFCEMHKELVHIWLTNQPDHHTLTCNACHAKWNVKEPYKMLRWERI